jgi:hypothetical protein
MEKEAERGNLAWQNINEIKGYAIRGFYASPTQSAPRAGFPGTMPELIAERFAIEIMKPCAQNIISSNLTPNSFNQKIIASLAAAAPIPIAALPKRTESVLNGSKPYFLIYP